MSALAKKRFAVTATELDSRLEEQNALVAVFALAGTMAAGSAHAYTGTGCTETGTGNDCPTPCCTFLSW